MNNFLRILILCLVITTSAIGQEVDPDSVPRTEYDFGVIGGLLHARADVKLNIGTATAKETGFFAGVLLDIGITEKTHLQPELLYAKIDRSAGLIFPVLIRVYLSEKLNIQFGPQVAFSLEEVPDDYTGVEFDATAGLGFDLFDKLIVEARYAVQISNSYIGNQDIKARATYFTLGLGYKF